MNKAWVAVACLLCGGCGVERTLTVESNPPGAMVTLNDQEIGRTPVTRDFRWYGTYDLELRKDGYHTLKSKSKVWAPWWQIVPIDLVADLWPMRLYDPHQLQFTLSEQSAETLNPETMISRAERLKARLEASQIPGRAATRPALPAGHHKPTATQP